MRCRRSWWWIISATMLVPVLTILCLFTPAAITDREAWAIYQCGHLELVLFVRSDDKLEGYPTPAHVLDAEILDRASRVDLKRRYLITLTDLCQFEPRKTNGY